ncbi:hypothetical protein HPB50_012171 [Hyalomma asiaticum]|uniref:Uncharacterized protein n=1 Tax=Hyalomma asiaticum TaxID=266040 RepID=A0ACB7RYY3_HYAAI|nr:hypothetical protein HPB50_012171 [Hyalomma asiaticum]
MHTRTPGTYTRATVMHRFNPDTLHALYARLNDDFEQMWLCPANVLVEVPSQKAWNQVITNSRYEKQLKVAQWAPGIDENLGHPAPSWAEPPC